VLFDFHKCDNTEFKVYIHYTQKCPSWKREPTMILWPGNDARKRPPISNTILTTTFDLSSSRNLPLMRSLREEINIRSSRNWISSNDQSIHFPIIWSSLPSPTSPLVMLQSHRACDSWSLLSFLYETTLDSPISVGHTNSFFPRTYAKVMVEN
jgi:hypothetical protein